MEIFDIIILAMVAGFILLRLRSELGNKHGNEPLPPQARPMNGASGMQDNRTIEGEAVQEPNPAVVDMESDPLLRKAYGDIRRIEPRFDVGVFLDGASAAYRMVLEAFWGGDRQTLEQLLSPDVYAQFEGAITAREDAGQLIENQILDLDSVKVTAGRVVDKIAELTVHITAEIISVTRDKDGNVIEGNVSDAITVNDSWTFSRNLKDRDPSWTLIATRAG